MPSEQDAILTQDSGSKWRKKKKLDNCTESERKKGTENNRAKRNKKEEREGEERE